MSGINFIFVVSLLVAGLLSAAFWLISVWSEQPRAARVIAGGYAVGMLYYIAELSIPHVTNPTMADVMAFVAVLSALTGVSAGITLHFERRPKWFLLAAILVVGPFVVALTDHWPRHSYLRMFVYQTPLALTMFVCMSSIWTAVRGRLEALLLFMLTANAVHFLLKPLLAQILGGAGTDPAHYAQTVYALVSQSMGVVFAVATALLTMAIMVRALLHTAAVRSEIDKLSGVLNRRGFERAAEEALLSAERKRRPVALIISDIDQFKSVNDRFGHAAGDQAIRVFARILSEPITDYLIGRIGGEEFAVMVVGAEISAGRLYAEGVRIAFSSARIDGLGGEKVTASFGVAERVHGESLSQFMRRADLALYDAKNSGRDCVRTALHVAGLTRGEALDASARGLATPVERRYPANSSGEK